MMGRNSPQNSKESNYQIPQHKKKHLTGLQRTAFSLAKYTTG